MVFVEGGDFTLGSKVKEENNPVKRAALESFYIDQDEVTNLLFPGNFFKYFSNNGLTSDSKSNSPLPQPKGGKAIL